MNVLIELLDSTRAKLEVNGVDLAKYAKAFTLSMQAGESPTLTVDIDPLACPGGKVEAILPDGAVYIKDHPPDSES